MLLMKALFKPVMAVPIKVTVTMPITMPKVVSNERILLPRMAPHEMPNPSLSSVKKFTTKKVLPKLIQDRADYDRRVSFVNQSGGDLNFPLHRFTMDQQFVAGDQTIPDADNAAGMAGDVLFVSHHNDGIAFFGEFFEERQDFVAGFRVEIAGGLVREQDRGLVH